MMVQSSAAGSFHRNKVKINDNPAGHWRVGKLILDASTRTATWDCPNCSITVMFPATRSPLSNGETQKTGTGSVTAQIDIGAKGYYPYCILVQDQDGDFHLVEGNSPPEMIIE